MPNLLFAFHWTNEAMGFTTKLLGVLLLLMLPRYIGYLMICCCTIIHVTSHETNFLLHPLFSASPPFKESKCKRTEVTRMRHLELSIALFIFDKGTNFLLLFLFFEIHSTQQSLFLPKCMVVCSHIGYSSTLLMTISWRSKWLRVIKPKVCLELLKIIYDSFFGVAFLSNRPL